MNWLKRLAARVSRRSAFGCWTSVLAKIDAEILECEAAYIYARDSAQWQRMSRLGGQRDGLLTAKHMITEMSNAAGQGRRKETP